MRFALFAGIAALTCGFAGAAGLSESLPSESTVQIRFIDSATGYAIQPESVAARPHVTAEIAGKNAASRPEAPEWIPVARFYPDRAGRTAIALGRGRHTVTAHSPNHWPISGEIEVRENFPHPIRFLLDPLELPRELRADDIAARHRDDATLFQGFIVDEDSGEPLRGVLVRSWPSGAQAVSDARGYFQVYVPLQSDAEQEAMPANLIFEKPGYQTEERRHLELWPRGDWTYRIRLHPGGAWTVVDERLERRQSVRPGPGEHAESLHRYVVETAPVDPIADSAIPEISAGDVSAASGSVATIRIPQNIRVERNGVIYYVTMDFYTKHVLPHEWIASWNFTSLYAGAVAVRSYAINRLNGRGPNSDFDICGTSSCQVFNATSSSTRTDTAVNFTDGYVMLTANGNIASTEYSAENNSLDRACGDGFTAPSDGCLYDPICAGQARSGHGRGMCQRGSRRWGNGDNGFPARSWVWILNHYYPNLTLMRGVELAVGDNVRSRSSDCQVRACPDGGIDDGVACALITTKASGQTGVIIAGPIRVMADGKGFTWCQVQWNDASSTTGWSCENYLERLFPVPTAPAGLTAVAVATNRINLNWTDTSDVETGFYIERAPAATGPWIHLAAVEANVTSFSDVNLFSGNTWYYRVRSYNAAGNSAYTIAVSATTPNTVAPVLAPIPNRTIAPGTTLMFTNSASAPERVQLITDFEPFMSETANGVVLFRNPRNSSSTAGFLNGEPPSDITAVVDTRPLGVHASGNVLRVICEFTNSSNPWLRLTTVGAVTFRNPVIDFTRKLRFDIYADRPVKVAVGCRETSTPAGTAIGVDGGTTGSSIEWAGVTGLSGTAPIPTRTVSNSWTRLTFDFPSEPIRSFSGGNGVLATASGLGVLEHLAIVPTAGTGVYNIYLDNFTVAGPRAFSYALGEGAPPNASLNPSTGVFTWTPTLAQSPSTNEISIILTDDSVPPFRVTNTFTVMVKENPPNTPPILYPIDNRTVYAGSTLMFTNVAYDPDPEDTLTFSLDPGAPAAALIHPTTGIFSWTTNHDDTNSLHYISVRVTDNGTPPLSGSATFSVTVLPPPPPNYAPMLYPIENRTLAAGSTLTFTNQAFDPNPGDTLTFSLDAGAPAGATVHPDTGVFTWTPTDADSDTVKSISVRVTDDGYPLMSGSTSFSVTVLPRPANQSPVLAPIADRVVHAGATITFTNSASDPDPADTLMFSLDENAPLDAAIDVITGVFTWTVPATEAATTNHISVLVTDDGEPPLSDSVTFAVVVEPPPALEAALVSGNTLVLTWSAISNTTYRIQFKNDLADGQWQALEPDITATNSAATASDAALENGLQRFYRVLVVQ